MRRDDCGRLLKAILEPDDLVVCSLGSVNRTWRSVQAPQAAYFCSDPMGIALPIGLGLALARPATRVVMLCGDGELGMGLSSLATVAAAAPANLRVIVFNNRRYETGGAQPLPNPDISFAVVARGAGFPWAEEARSQDQAAELMPALLALPGLGLLSLAIDPDPLGYGPPPALSQAEERTLFMRRIGSLGDA
jgi:thiamine pyrophosphate-dependent acetolactate synthase large subunit-like protein